MTKYYNKLVRDKIPEIIKASGKVPVIYYADNEEYYKFLQVKLTEELSEFMASNEVEELADLCEVINSILVYKGITHDIFKQIMEEKREKRGAFENRIILERVDD